MFEPILKGWDLRGAPSGEGRMQSELLETTTNHACPTTSTTRTKKCTLAKQSTLSRVFYHECLKPPAERGRGRERGKGRTKGRGRGGSRGRLNCHLLACGSTRLYDAASVITIMGLWARDGPEGRKMQRRITIMFLFAPCHTLSVAIDT